MTSYDDWKLMSPDDERAEREAATRRWLRRHNFIPDGRDPDAERDAQQDREMRGEG